MTEIDYGLRARIGAIIPSVNVAAESEFSGLAPDGVRFHTTRLKLAGSTEKELLGMADDVEPAARLLNDAGVGLVIFHCTAVTTFAKGFDDKILARVKDATGLAATATSKAILTALEALGVRKVALLTPYIPATNAREVAFLEASGVTVTSEAGMALEGGGEMIKPTSEDWYDYAMAHRDAEADAYFLSCTAIRATPAIQRIEEALDRPVITSNSAAIWHCLRLSGVEDRLAGYGTLLAEH